MMMMMVGLISESKHIRIRTLKADFTTRRILALMNGAVDCGKGNLASQLLGSLIPYRRQLLAMATPLFRG